MAVKCTYCGKVARDPSDNCAACGAALPEEVVQAQKPEVKKTGVLTGVALFAVLVVGALILFLIPDGSAPAATGPSVTPIPVDQIREHMQNQQEDEAPDGNRGAPADHITDSGLRQSLELFFRQELTQIDWDTLAQIKTMVIDSEFVAISTEHIPLGQVESSALALQVQPDAVIEDANQLKYLEGLEVLAIRHGQIGPNLLRDLPNIQELDVIASRMLGDLTAFAVMPELSRLTVSGRNFDSLQGISELPNLYALGLYATGISDLSVLSIQQNVTELAFVNNRQLSSLNTLQEMSWLRSLHIERTEDINLHFINEMTNLESLTIVRTDARSYDFILPLTNLRYLRLFDNRDVPEIPSLAGFTHLEELHLHTGRNTGRVRPTTYLEGLTSVRKMTLHNADTLDALQGMENLEELHLNFGWLLTDAAPLGALQNLHTLRIYDSRTYGSEVRNMAAIGQLSNLRRLDLSDNEIFFNWNFIYGLTQLEELNISRNTVVGDFSGIANLQQLRVLDMANVRLVSSFQISGSGGLVGISWPEPYALERFSDALASLSSLESLTIDGNNVRDINFVSHLHHLQYFQAESNYIADVSPLSELTELIFVNLRRNPVTNWQVLDRMINTTLLGR